MKKQNSKRMTDDKTLTKKDMSICKANTERFSNQVSKHTIEIGDCIVWTGATNGKGHGRIRLFGKLSYVHRLVYIMNFGTIPNGYNVHHICENPSCVNPKHLALVVHGKHTQLHKEKITLEEAII